MDTTTHNGDKGIGSQDDIAALVSFIDEIQTREQLNEVERAVIRKRIELADIEQKAREADPEYQRRVDESRRELDEEMRRWDEEDARRREARQRRLDEAPVVGTLTFTRIRPQYLNGQTIEVIGVNEKSYKCNVPDDPKFKTWAGRKGIRVPKASAEFHPGATL